MRISERIPLSHRSISPLDILTVDVDSSVHLHRQIYESLRSYILEGRLAPESVLPSTRALSQQLRVGRNTVIAAYDQLLAEGYVEAQSGSGTRVARLLHGSVRSSRHDTPASAQLSRRGSVIASTPQPHRPSRSINAQPAFPDVATFPFSIWSRLIARNAQRHDDDLLGYHSFAGHQRLRQAVAGYLGVARGVDCAPEQVIIVTGAQAALDLVSRILVDQDDCVWMEEPGYLGARSAFLGSGARVAPLRVSARGWELHDPSLLPPRLIYVTPSCQWPFGTIMRMEERLQLLALAEQHQAWIIEDDYDGEYRFRGRPVPALRGLDHAHRVIYVGTFGKTLLPSLRLGYLVVPLELSDAFSRAVSVTGQFAPLLLQATVADFIQEGYFATHLKRMRRLYARRQANFVELCHRHLSEWLTVAENDAGMQVLGRFVQRFDDRVVAAAALSQGLDVQPISINYHHGNPEHGLLLGFAGLDEQRTSQIIMVLKKTFESLAANGASVA